MAREETFSIVKGVIKEVLRYPQDQEISEADSWDELGADSLDVVEITSESMKRLMIKVPHDLRYNTKDLRTLLDTFEQCYTESS